MAGAVAQAVLDFKAADQRVKDALAAKLALDGQTEAAELEIARANRARDKALQALIALVTA